MMTKTAVLKRCLLSSVASAALLVLGHQTAVAAPNEAAIKALVEKAKFWTNKGRKDLANDIWKKLLQVDPDNADALAALAKEELDNDQVAAGKVYIERLKKSKPNSAIAKELQSEVIYKTVDIQKLAEAREASRLGQVEQAVKHYRQLFGGKPPPAEFALEYYSIMGANDQLWEEARQGLARLHQQDPDNRDVALMYARHLTFRLPSRREGVQLLSQLVRQKPNDPEAADSWKQALTWLDAKKADIPLFQAYLNAKGNDPVIRGRIQAINQADAVTKPGAYKGPAGSSIAPGTFQLDAKSQALMAGFQAFQAGNIDEASAKFEKVLSESPNNGDAMGGLGIVRQKQERFDEAIRLLEQAVRLSGGGKWKEALRGASFWQQARLGMASLEAGQLNEAQQRFENARSIDPSQPILLQGFADVAYQQNRLTDAERGYRELLRKEPKSLAGTRGLIGVLAQQGNVDEATALLERLTDEQRDEMGGYGALKAQQLRKLATGYAQRGDTRLAIQTLEDALMWDPVDPWLRLELARMYQSVGAAREARAVVDGLLVSNPNLPTALYTSALMSAESQDWVRGLDQLERVPESNRTKEMTSLQHQLWVRAQIDRASQMQQSGLGTAALDLLRQMEPIAGRDPTLVGLLAQGYASAGDNGKALSLMRGLLAQNSRPETGLLIQYAGILLSTGQDTELAGHLRNLYGMSLTDEQRRGLDQVRSGYVLRQFESLRLNNQFAAAYEVLANLYRERPDDLQVHYAWGRLYASTNDPKEALAWFDYALRRDPTNLAGLVSAAGAAMAIPNYSYAESALNNARQLSPNNPDVLAGLGRLYRAQGKVSQATDLLQRALVLEQQRVNSRPEPITPSYPSLVGSTYIPATAAVYTSAPALPAASSPVLSAPMPALQPTQAGQQAPRITIRPGDRVSATTLNGQVVGANSERLAPLASAVASAPVAGALLPVAATQAKVIPVQYTYPSTPAPVLREIDRPAAYVPGTAPAIAAGNNQGLLLIPPPTTVRPAAPVLTTIATTGTADTRQLSSLRNEVADLRESSSGSIAAGLNFRQRQGVAGLSQLSEVSMPIEVRLPGGDTGQLVARLAPVTLDTGKLTQTNLNTSQGFGTNAIDSVNTLTNNNAYQRARGLGVGIGYETLQLKLDIGASPLGFRVVNLIGGLAYSSRLSDTNGLRLELSRRPVTDSLLSYAGTVDDRTGLVWGGVTATGGRGEFSAEHGDFGGYGYAGYHFLTGRNVANNTRAEAGLGMYYKPIREPDQDVSVGIGLTALGYNKNLRYYTFGHGGYFSPQRYLALNFPVEWAGRAGQLSFKLDASVGIQSFRENGANYFPTSGALQSAWANSAATANAANTAAGVTNLSWQATYPGMSKTGYGYRFGGAAEYRLAPHWFLGGRLLFDNASNYSQSSGLVYMRYSFEPSTRLVTFPPNTLRTYP